MESIESTISRWRVISAFVALRQRQRTTTPVA